MSELFTVYYKFDLHIALVQRPSSQIPDGRLRPVSNTYLQLQKHIGLVTNTYLKHTQVPECKLPVAYTYMYLCVFKAERGV